MRLITLFAVCCSLTLYSCREHQEEEKSNKTYPITQPVVKDTSIIRDYVAQIESIQHVELRAQAKGYLQDILVDEGQFVRAGQLLFTIMPRQYEADFLKAKAEARKAELEWQNTKLLADKNIVSQNELAIAQTQFEQAKAVLAQADVQLSFTKIKAPFDGVIDRIRFKQGSLVDEGTLLTTISNNRDVFAYFNVSEVEYLNYSNKKSSDKQTIELLLANGQTHPSPGTIETVEGEFDNSTGNIAFRARFPNPKLILKHGETGRVRMNIHVPRAMLIPQKATYDLQDKTYVYVVDSKQQVHARQIEVQYRLPNIYVVQSGLKANEQILLEGVQNVRDDDHIVPKKQDPVQVLNSLQLIN